MSKAVKFAIALLVIIFAAAILGVFIYNKWSVNDGSDPVQYTQYAVGDDLYYVCNGKLYFYNQGEDKAAYIDEIPAIEVAFCDDKIYYCYDTALVEYDIKTKQRQDVYTFDSDFLIYQVSDGAAYIGVKRLDSSNHYVNDVYCASIDEKTAEPVFKSDYWISDLAACGGTLYYIEMRTNKNIYLSDWLCSYTVKDKKRRELFENPIDLCESDGEVFTSIMNDGVYKITGAESRRLVKTESDTSAYASLLALNKNYLYYAVYKENEAAGTYAYDLNADTYEMIFDDSGNDFALAENGIYIYRSEYIVSYYDFSTRKTKEITNIVFN